MIDKYIIIDLRTMDYMKNSEGKIIYYNSYDDAYQSCWVNEPDNVWICKLIHNYIEPLQ